MFKLLLNCS